MVPQHGKNNPASAKSHERPVASRGAAAPLEEGIRSPRARRYSTGTFSALRYDARNIQTDFAVANALQRVGRKVSEDFPGIGEYVASVGEEFERMEQCQVYMALRQKSRDKEPTSLERRIRVWRDGPEWCIDDSAGHLIMPPDEIFGIFRDRTPTVLDGNAGLKLTFGNMDMDDDKCQTRYISRDAGSSAMMPFYYRDRKQSSGIVLFEGDLACRGSEVSGFSRAYWTARLAMSMAAQLSFQFTHRFDAITTLCRVQDFEVDIRRSIRKTIKMGDELCLVHIDLDNFKGVNDEHGHNAGDAVLREAADAVKRSIRADDSAARKGGDELTVILRRVPWTEAISIAQRILETISNLVISYNGKQIRVTCSIGAVNVKRVAEELKLVGNFRPSEEQVELVYGNAFDRSDALLQEAKRTGRARVVSA